MPHMSKAQGSVQAAEKLENGFAAGRDLMGCAGVKHMRRGDLMPG